MAGIPRDVEINAPELLTRPMRTRDTVFTAAMWALYLYLWVPLLSLMAWLLGIEFAYEVVLRAGGVRGLLSMLTAYSVVVAVIFLVVAMWSLINRVRFAHLERRQHKATISNQDLAEHFDISQEEVGALRAGRRIQVRIDEHGRPQTCR